jgi:hypothetical protein
MRIARSALDQVKTYAAERGCTQLEEPAWRFIAPDRSRAIRISEISTYFIYLWDTAEGKVSIPREGRNARIIRSKAKKGDDAEGDRCGRPSAHEERRTV